MSEHKIIKGPPSETKIIQWGYDENLFFSEEDEDQVLTHIDYAKILIKLASDPKCPKQKLALSILHKLMQQVFLARNFNDAERLIYHATKTHFDVPALVEWVNMVKGLNDALLEPEPMSFDEAVELAGLLLDLEEIKHTGKELRGYWEFEGMPSDNLPGEEDPQNFLYINGETGDWIYSKFKTMKSIEEE